MPTNTQSILPIQPIISAAPYQFLARDVDGSLHIFIAIAIYDGQKLSDVVTINEEEESIADNDSIFTIALNRREIIVSLNVEDNMNRDRYAFHFLRFKLEKGIAGNPTIKFIVTSQNNADKTATISMADVEASAIIGINQVDFEVTNSPYLYLGTIGGTSEFYPRILIIPENVRYEFEFESVTTLSAITNGIAEAHIILYRVNNNPDQTIIVPTLTSSQQFLDSTAQNQADKTGNSSVIVEVVRNREEAVARFASLFPHALSRIPILDIAPQNVNNNQTRMVKIKTKDADTM